MRKMLCRLQIANVLLQYASTGDVAEQWCACGVIGRVEANKRLPRHTGCDMAHRCRAAFAEIAL
jgi:hypothetical protein